MVIQDKLTEAVDNLAMAATNDHETIMALTDGIKQLTAANSALTAQVKEMTEQVRMLTNTNAQLVRRTQQRTT